MRAVVNLTTVKAAATRAVFSCAGDAISEKSPAHDGIAHVDGLAQAT